MRLHEVLTRLFDQGPLRRVDWADVLGADESDVDRWATRPLAPTADQLCGILDIARPDDRIPNDILRDLEAVIRLPIEESMGEPWLGLGKTLRHYMVRPRLTGALALLDCLPPEEQEEVLVAMGEMVRERLQAKP